MSTSMSKAEMSNIRHILEFIRKYYEDHIGTGTDLCGYCFEASEWIEEVLLRNGYESVAVVEGYVYYDDWQYGTNQRFDAHAWVEYTDDIGAVWILDVTADQFNYGMDPENKFPDIVFTQGAPHGYFYQIDKTMEEDE